MRKLFTLLISLFLWGSVVYGQVASYSFVSSSGTYTPITGGTIAATATSASGAGSLDDVNYTLAAGTIPFTFTYDGVGYTGLVINTNGYITFGSTPPSSSGYAPLSATTAYAGAISAIGRDLNSLYNISGFTGQIRYETVGTSPNREFVIQYSNFRPYSTSVSTTPIWRWNFQIRLSETNSISIVYDFNFVGVPTAGSGQVGLRGLNNSFATNVNNRLIVSGTNTWASSVVGTANTSTCAYSTTLLPVSGTTYTWTAPSLLAPGSFVAAPVSSNQISVSFVPTGTPANNAVVVWNTTGTFTDPTGTPPAVGEAFAGGTLLYNGTTSPVMHTGLVYGTTYYYKAWSFSGSAYSGGVTTSASPSVAAPTALVATAVSTSEIDLTWIKNSANHDVIVATNSTSTFGTPTNGSGYSVNDLITGGGSVIYIGPASGFNHTGLATATQYFYKVWSVDASNYYSSTGATANKTTLCDAISSLPWNEGFESVAIPAFPSCWSKENGDWVTTNNANTTYDANAYTGTQFLRESWTASNEYIWTPGFSLDAGTSYDFSFYWAGDNYSGWVGDVFSNTSQISTGATQLGESFVVAATTTTKTYSQVLRTFIPATSGDYFFAIRVNEAVGEGWYLSFDDFKLELTPSCPMPQALSATGVYGHQATLDWTEIGSATTWELEWGASGFTPGTGTIVSNITTKPYILMGLAPSTAYAYYVRSDCGGGSTSDPAGPKVFTTTVSCPAPTLLNSSNITVSTADINWTSNGLEAAWDIIYGPAGFVAGSGIGYTEVLGTSTKPYPLTALSSGTIYDYYVRAACGVSNVSAWSVKGSFTTVCEIVTVFPHNQSFDGTFPPACWTRFTGVLAAPSTLAASTFGWIQDDWRNVVGTDKAARDNIYSTGHYNWLVTPAFDLATDMQLEFDLALNAFATSNAPGTTGVDDRFAVVISTDGGVTWSSANTLRLWDNAGSTYVYNNISPAGERIILDLSAYTRSTVKIGFYGESTVSNADNDLMINNLVVQEPPSCAAPYSLTATPAAFQAVLGWTEAGTATEWEIEYGLAGFTPGTGTPVLNVTVNPYTLTGLTPSTAYNFYVKANCGAGLVSSPSAVKPFTTTVACPQPTALTATDISTDRADLGWTEAGSATTWNVEYGEVPWTQGTGTMLTGVTTNPVNIAGLSAAKTYSFYVKADCGSGYESLWSGPKTFTTLLCPATSQCSYTIDLTDAYGDGWNGAVLGFRQGGLVVGTFGTGFTTGSTYGPVSVSLCDALSTEIMVVSAGSYPEEVGFVVTDPFGNIVYTFTEGTGFTTSTVFTTFTTQCTVLEHDVATLSIDDVPAQILTGTVITPKATVKNNGSSTETFDVTISTSGYTSTQTVTDLAPGASLQVTFATWTPASASYSLQACAVLTGDLSPSNDCKSLSVLVDPNLWTSGSAYPTTTYMGSGVGYTDYSVTPSVGYLFSMGGNTSSALGTECYKYNVNTDTWSAIASLPAKRLVMGSAQLGNYVYVIGGSDGAATPVTQSTVYRYDITADVWTTVAPLPVALSWAKAVAYGTNYIYVAGGVAVDVVATVYVYDVALNTWSAATSMPGPKFGGAFSVTGNSLVYVAGADLTVISNSVYVGTISLSDPTIITWATKSAYPGSLGKTYNDAGYDKTALYASHSKPSNNKVGYPGGTMYRFDGAPWGSDGIIVAAGSPSAAWTPANPNPCYVYKPATDTWIAKPNLNVPVLGASTGSVDIKDGEVHTWKIVVASGYTGTVASTATQILSETINPSVTFQVNMSQQTVSPLGVFLAGNFQGWNSSSTPLTDMGGGVWAVTLALAPGDYQYKFINGTTWESVPGACNISGNRYVTITNSTTLPLVCYGSCSNCATQVALTLTVDMANQVVSANGVHVTGSFQGWNPGSTLMTQIATTTMYEVMVYVDENSTHQYKFINGNDWPDSEVVPEACGVDNGFGGFNRTVTVTTGMYAADMVCFGECSLCATDKTLTIKALLQGLMAPRDLGSGPELPPAGTMYEAMDGNTGLPQFDYGIADAVTVQLYEPAPGFALVTEFTDVQLNTDGTASITVGAGFSGDYYIRVVPRTHIAVWSANTVSFASATINYDFSDNFTKAYQYPGGDLEPMKEMTPGVYALYLGDQDKNTYIDIDDMSSLVPDVVNGTVGYVDSDIDGAGWVDIDDMGLLEPNVVIGQYEQNPTFGKGMQRHLRRSR